MELLEKDHKRFCLGDNDREETDLVQFEIDTGEVMPMKQCAWSMPLAVRREIS